MKVLFFKKLSIIGFLLIIGCSIKATNIYDFTPCDANLEKAEAEADPSNKIKKIKKVLKKCPEYVPSHLAIAELYQTIGEDQQTNWQKDAMGHYFKVIELDENNEEARWKVANILEFVEHYAEAKEYYDWIVVNGKTEKRKSEAKAHLVVCDFLLRKGENKDVQKGVSDHVKDIDFSEEAIKWRSSLTFLKQVVAAVAISGNIKGMNGNGKYIQTSLGLILDWIDAPKDEKVAARNTALLGMITTVVSVISEKQIGGKIGGVNFNSFMPQLNQLPQNQEANDAASKFQVADPDKGRTIQISDDFEVIEKWDIPDLSGTWSCTTIGGHCDQGIFLDGIFVGNIQMDGNLMKFTVIQGGETFIHEGKIDGRDIELICDKTTKRGSITYNKYVKLELKIISENRLAGSWYRKDGNSIAGTTSTCTAQIRCTR